MLISETAGESVGARRAGILASAVVPLGSFLLFLVQPVAGKAWTPTFGGSAGLWLAALMFFQVLLFLGYLYAHLLLTRVPARFQSVIHLVLLAATQLHQPRLLVPADAGSVVTTPFTTLFTVLVSGIGIQYLALASTSTLAQGWMTLLGTRKIPYRLFALSNLFSIAGLVAYPFVLEPLMTIDRQLLVWRALFSLYALLFAVLSWIVLRMDPSVVEVREFRSTVPERMLWTAFPAVGSVLLLGFTSRLCQDVVPVPLLWVLPLAAYLLSFVLAFERPGWYRREPWLAVSIAFTAGMVLIGESADLRLSVALNVLSLFTLCVVCHGELYRIRPRREGLSIYYLLIALGGALGSIGVVWGATLVLEQYTELYFGIVATVVLLLIVPAGGGRSRSRSRLAIVFGITGLGLLFVTDRNGDAVDSRRNFYGIVSVHDSEMPETGAFRFLRHGKVSHGVEILASGTPGSYYGPSTAPARLLRDRAEGATRKIGIIGLGAGALAYYGEPGDTFVFYEINPAVIEFTSRYFSFLPRSKATVEVAVGDARLTLTREAPRGFDVLVVDAFSGDAVPYHLLTREALEVYRRHMKPDGIIAFHLSNSYLNLLPIVKKLAVDAGMASRFVSTPADGGLMYEAAYGLITADSDRLARSPVGGAPAVEVEVAPAAEAWTDRYSSIVKAIR